MYFSFLIGCVPLFLCYPYRLATCVGGLCVVLVLGISSSELTTNKKCVILKFARSELHIYCVSLGAFTFWYWLFCFMITSSACCNLICYLPFRLSWLDYIPFWDNCQALFGIFFKSFLG